MATLFRAVGATGGTPRALSGYNTTTARWMTLERPLGIDYQVPAGKVFKITRVVFSSSVASTDFALGYGDTAVAEGGTEPTAAIYIVGRSDPTALGSPVIAPVANTMYAVDLYAEVPASKYPFLRGNIGNGYRFILVIGVEE